MATSLKANDRIANHTLTATVTSGTVYEGGVIGVYLKGGVSGDSVPIAFEGTFELAKATGTAYAVGDLLYWNTTNNNLTKTNTDSPAGICMKAAASAATTAWVALNGFES